MDALSRFTAVVHAAGYRSLARWADHNGFQQTSVYRVVRIWGDREKTPHGGTARRIISALRDLERNQQHR